MLANHPDLAVANDTHFITRAAKKELRKTPDPLLTAGLIEKVCHYHRFPRMGLDEVSVRQAAQGAHYYSEFVSRLYTLRGEHFGKPLSGEKSPDFCRNIPVLNALLPWAKFVHIIRDGRNTALSALKWASSGKGPGRWALWDEDPVACCALWWRWQTGAGIRDGRSLPGRLCHEVKYEDLVAEPRATLSQVAEFLGIRDSDDMHQYFQGKTRLEPGLSAKSAWLPPTKGLRNWRTQMRPEDLAVFEAIAGALLQGLGYELSGAVADIAGRVRIERAITWWQDQPFRDGGIPADLPGT